MAFFDTGETLAGSSGMIDSAVLERALKRQSSPFICSPGFQSISEKDVCLGGEKITHGRRCRQAGRRTNGYTDSSFLLPPVPSFNNSFHTFARKSEICLLKVRVVGNDCGGKS